MIQIRDTSALALYAPTDKTRSIARISEKERVRESERWEKERENGEMGKVNTKMLRIREWFYVLWVVV